MDTNKMREDFEVWVLREYPNQVMGRFNDGEYHSTTVQHCWLAWQASREAVVVELPELRSVPDRDCWARTNGLGFNNALNEARQVIEAQGLRVTP